MSSGLFVYGDMWKTEDINISSTFNAYTTIDHLLPSASSGIYSVFPTQSFRGTYPRFNTTNLTVNKYTAANYSIAYSSSTDTNTIGIFFYPYISFYPGTVDDIVFGYPYEIDFFLSYSLDWKTYDWPNQQPVMRSGLYVYPSTGSPQLNLQTITQSTDIGLYIVGDLFYSASDGYYVNFHDASRKLVTMRRDENLGRYNTIENPYNLHLEQNSVVTDNFYQTVSGTNSLDSGALWKNENWQGGVYMPTINDVSVFGTKNFLVSSGGFISSGSVTASAVTFNQSPTTWTINSVSHSLTTIGLEFRDTNVTIPGRVQLATASLLVIGDTASIKINSYPMNPILMVSGALSFESGSAGDIKVFSASIEGVFHEGYIYVSGTWHPLLSSSDSYTTLSNGIF